MYSDTSSNSPQKMIASIVVLTAVAIIAFGLKPSPAKQTAQAAASNTMPTTTNGAVGSGAASAYRDGVYTASANYYVPHGDESIKVTLALQNGVVTSSSIQNSQGNPVSASFQLGFAASYKSYVLGKDISSLELSYVSGASDTTQGFDNALAQIRTQAKT